MGSIMNIKRISGISAALLLSAANSQAGGLWLNEFGDYSGGRASAGAAAGTDDAATIIHNPASGSLIEGSQLFGSVGVLIPNIEFDIDYTNPISGNDDGGSAGLNAPVASFAYVHDSGDSNWTFGVSTAGLAGAGLEYNRDWVGRFQATDVELLLLALAPTASYRINDRLSVGASVQYLYGSLDMKLAIPSLGPDSPDRRAKLDGTDQAFAFTLGTIYEWGDKTRIGIRYQSEIEADFDGKLKGELTGVRVDSNTELTMAQLVRVGIRHQLDPDFAIDFTWGWDDWSALDSVFVSLPELEAPLQKNWDDTYHYAVGFELDVDRHWEITAGLSYDTNPVSAHDRTADLPVDRQVRYNFGTRYHYSESLTFGGYVNYTDLGSARISGERWGGDYDKNEMWSLSAFLNWKL
jgi:long-chain fatty acid transport protein